MSRIMKKVNIFFVMIFLAGCMPAVTPFLEDVTSTETLSPFPVMTDSPTQILILPTPTSEDMFGSSCFDVVDKAPKSKLGKGVVVLENKKIGMDGRVMSGFFLLNIETNEFRDLEKQNEGLSNAFVSPDGTMLSVEFITFEKNDDSYKILSDELLIMTSDGTIQKRLPMEDGAVYGPTWLDNQRLVINIAGLDPEENQGIKPSTLLILNPFTGERQILKSDFPNMYDGYPPPFWGEPWGYSLSVYNKPLTRVVYLSKGGYTYVLWDIQKKKELLQFVHWNNANHEQPRWSPDGSKFVVSAYFGEMSNWPQPADGLYIIDVDGNITKLISQNIDLDIRDHYWSPSGRYLALFLYVKNPNTREEKVGSVRYPDITNS